MKSIEIIHSGWLEPFMVKNGSRVFVKEPTIEQLEAMLANLRQEKQKNPKSTIERALR